MTTELVERAIKGDKDAFSDIYSEYSQKLYRLFFSRNRNPWLSDDLVQETFTKAFVRINTLRDPSKFWGWLKKLAARVKIDNYRKNKKFCNSVELLEMDQDKCHHQPAAPIKYMEIFDIDISEKYMQYLKMFYEQGMACEQIAETFGVTLNATYVIMHRARLAVKKELSKRNIRTLEDCEC